MEQLPEKIIRTEPEETTIQFKPDKPGSITGDVADILRTIASVAAVFVVMKVLNER